MKKYRYLLLALLTSLLLGECIHVRIEQTLLQRRHVGNVNAATAATFWGGHLSIWRFSSGASTRHTLGGAA